MPKVWLGLAKGWRMSEKANKPSMKEHLLKKLEGEKELIEWSVKLQRKARKGRFKKLMETQKSYSKK